MNENWAVSIVEYGIGNIGSVLHACKRAGITPSIAHDGQELESHNPKRILLPGVGAIGEALKQLRARDFEPVLNRMVFDQKTPILGICVGMQILAEICEEFGEHAGLGWLPGARAGRIADKGAGLRLPHVGWNTIEPAVDDPLIADIADEHFYFAHSYSVRCDDEFVLARTNYGGPFVSAVRRENVFGVQFHPEKSSSAGARLLRNFTAASLCSNGD